MQWIFIIAIIVILYLAISIRVLRQYERGVVFLLGASRACASLD